MLVHLQRQRLVILELSNMAKASQTTGGLATNQSGGYWTKGGTAAQSYLKKAASKKSPIKKPAPKKKTFSQTKFNNAQKSAFGLYSNAGKGMGGM